MANLKRYDVGEDEYGGYEELECADGIWVKFDDIKELLNTSTNKHYASALKAYNEWGCYIRQNPHGSNFESWLNERLNPIMDGA